MPIGVQGSVVNQPAREWYVRVNIAGILQTDRLQHTAIFGFTQGYWTVVRDSKVVAVIADPEFEGIACRGSGIGAAWSERGHPSTGGARYRHDAEAAGSGRTSSWSMRRCSSAAFVDCVGGHCQSVGGSCRAAWRLIMTAWGAVRRRLLFLRVGTKRRVRRLTEPEVKARNLDVLEERAAGKPLGPAVSSDSLQDFLRDVG